MQNYLISGRQRSPFIVFCIAGQLPTLRRGWRMPLRYAPGASSTPCGNSPPTSKEGIYPLQNCTSILKVYQKGKDAGRR